MNTDNILQSLNEAIEFERGDKTKARSKLVEIIPIPNFSAKEVKEIRIKLNLTQNMFAELMGVSIKTIEAWESGRNVPNGTAQRMMSILNDEPQIMQKVIITA